MVKKAKRGFELVMDDFRRFPEAEITLPKRSTVESAGYDFRSLETKELQPGETYMFVTDVCAFMQPDEVLILNVRSSMGFKQHLRLINTQGWVDSDFYMNPENGGNIGIGLYNWGKEPVMIYAGDRIAQGMFQHYLSASNEEKVTTVRKGGVGSTGR